MVSTPNAPDGLFERRCLSLQKDYTYGIGKIYTAEEIEKVKQSPSFERGYNLKYLGIGKAQLSTNHLITLYLFSPYVLCSLRKIGNNWILPLAPQAGQCCTAAK